MKLQFEEYFCFMLTNFMSLTKLIILVKHIHSKLTVFCWRSSLNSNQTLCILWILSFLHKVANRRGWNKTFNCFCWRYLLNSKIVLWSKRFLCTCNSHKDPLGKTILTMYTQKLFIPFWHLTHHNWWCLLLPTTSGKIVYIAGNLMSSYPQDVYVHKNYSPFHFLLHQETNYHSSWYGWRLTPPYIKCNRDEIFEG